MGYAPIKRTCQRCGHIGNTDNIRAIVVIGLESEFFDSIHMKKWKNYCVNCEKSVQNTINEHMKSLDFSMFQIHS